VSELRILGGSAKGQRLHIPASARPTGARIRKSLFDILDVNYGAGSRVLDVCAGAGGVGLEAASRGFVVTLLERDSKAVETLDRNRRELKLRAEIVKTDALKYLERETRTWDVVFIDPPYEQDIPKYAALALSKSLIEPDGVVIVQHPDKVHLAAHDGYTLERRVYGSNALSLYWTESRLEESTP
jgi:16S rRNA (guanine(966)-N(2))-methyltransferase RsmD